MTDEQSFVKMDRCPYGLRFMEFDRSTSVSLHFRTEQDRDIFRRDVEASFAVTFMRKGYASNPPIYLFHPTDTDAHGHSFIVACPLAENTVLTITSSQQVISAIQTWAVKKGLTTPETPAASQAPEQAVDRPFVIAKDFPGVTAVYADVTWSHPGFFVRFPTEYKTIGFVFFTYDRLSFFSRNIASVFEVSTAHSTGSTMLSRGETYPLRVKGDLHVSYSTESESPFLMQIAGPAQVIGQILALAKSKGLLRQSKVTDALAQPAVSPASPPAPVAFDHTKIEDAYCRGNKAIIYLTVPAAANVKPLIGAIFADYIFQKEERTRFDVGTYGSGRARTEDGIKYIFRPKSVKDNIRDIEVFVPYSSKEMHFVKMPLSAETTIREWCTARYVSVQTNDCFDHLRGRPSRDVAGKEAPRQRYR